MAEKLCRDCKHFNGNYKFPKCKAPEAVRGTNFVTGQPLASDCQPMRKHGACGVDAILYISNAEMLMLAEVAA